MKRLEEAKAALVAFRSAKAANQKAKDNVKRLQRRLGGLSITEALAEKVLTGMWPHRVPISKVKAAFVVMTDADKALSAANERLTKASLAIGGHGFENGFIWQLAQFELTGRLEGRAA
jgi:hypothetical protein